MARRIRPPRHRQCLPDLAAAAARACSDAIGVAACSDGAAATASSHAAAVVATTGGGCLQQLRAPPGDGVVMHRTL
eukprot:363593-Chlamydomonas_euryale.AAC.1